MVNCIEHTGKDASTMLRIVTDTASDITLEQAAGMGVDMVPLVITFEDGVCPQETEADFMTFYERLQRCQELPVTSRPSPHSYLKIFQDAKAKGEEVVVLCVSSGLSGTMESAFTARQMADYEPIYIVDTRQAILTQRMLVELAVQMREDGHTAQASVTAWWYAAWSARLNTCVRAAEFRPVSQSLEQCSTSSLSLCWRMAFSKRWARPVVTLPELPCFTSAWRKMASTAPIPSSSAIPATGALPKKP